MKNLLKSRTWWLGVLSCLAAGFTAAAQLAPNVSAIVLAVVGAATIALRTQDKVNEK
jgi:uncharacterized membrane-anchored protein